MAPKSTWLVPLELGGNGKPGHAGPHILRPIDNKALEDAKLPRYTAETSGLW
jgi:hypothetical protein